MSPTLDVSEIATLIDRLESAERNGKPIPKLTDDFPHMTLADGYAVQLAQRHRRIAAGGRQVGVKAGLTSKAKMQQMGVHAPAIGFLMADMSRPEGSSIDTSLLVQPRIECEVAFMTGKPLSGLVSREEVLAATDFVMPALEVLDSRFAGFKFDLPSVVADNTSAAYFVAGGRPRLIEELNLDLLGVVLEKNGHAVGFGATAAVLDHPADAVALVVGVLHELGDWLPAGSFVMSGGITEAITVRAGDHVCARFQGLGSVAIHFA